MPNQKWIEENRLRYKKKLQRELGVDRVAELEKQGEKKREARLKATEDEYDKKVREGTKRIPVSEEESRVIPSLWVLQPESVWRRLAVRVVGAGGENIGLFVAKERDREKTQLWALDLVAFRAGQLTKEALDKKYTKLFPRAGAIHQMRTTVVANSLIDAIRREEEKTTS